MRIIWRWPTPDLRLAVSEEFDPMRSTPIVVDGVLYTISPLNQVSALDAETGRELWTFDPKVWQVDHFYRGYARGVSYWSDGSGMERIVFGTSTAYLYSLDARTGEPDPAFGDGGRIDLTVGLSRDFERTGYAFVSPPIICDGVVVTGSSNVDWRLYREHLPRLQPPGDVRGFDVRTGELLWTFHAIPRDGEFGADTWPAGAWRERGGTNVWSMVTADLELGYIYLPFSTPDNDFYGGRRHGDGLFGESLVCLEARSGRRVWHQQLIHHGLWDYDIPAAPVLADVVVDGRPRKIVAQVTKQAFCDVYDRVTGEPVWPIIERQVPQSTMPGEQSSPTQPFPTKPAAFDLQGLSTDDLIDFTPELRAEAEQIISGYRTGPLYTPPDLGELIIAPGFLGGADWAGAALDPARGMLYVPSKTRPNLLFLGEPETGEAVGFHRFLGEEGGIRGPQGLPLAKPPYGRITAIDLNTGDHSWIAATGRGPRDHPALRHLDLPDLGWDMRNFVIATPTLVLSTSERLGRGGDYWKEPERFLTAFEPASGRRVGRVPLPDYSYGNPMSFSAGGGRQYVVAPIGEGRSVELVALAIPRPGEDLPPQLTERYDAEHPQFYEAVALIDSGDVEGLRDLLAAEPTLISARGYLDSAYRDGNLKGGLLLHAVANNPTRVHALPRVREIAGLLLTSGAEVDALTAEGNSVLYLVVDSEQLRRQGVRVGMIENLVRVGVDPTQPDGRTLEQAFRTRHAELLAAVAKADFERDLRYAAALGEIETMEGFFSISGALLPGAMHPWAQAPPDSVETRQYALDLSLSYAARQGQIEAARFLLERGADVNARPPAFFWSGDRGSTALHKAAHTGGLEMVRWLLEHGADPTLSELNRNRLPSDWVRRENEDLAKLLAESEAAWEAAYPVNAAEDSRQ